MHTLDLEPVTATGTLPEDLLAFCRDQSARDLPTLPEPPAEWIAGRTRVPRSDELLLGWVLRRDQRIVAAMDLDLPLVDNTGTAGVNVIVHDALRRQGIGSALLERATAEARQHGRQRLIAEVGRDIDGPPSSGDRFAEHHGFSAALAELFSDLDLTTLDAEGLTALQRQADEGSLGYRVRTWVGLPADDVVPQLGHLESTLSADAPLGDLVWEREVWEADRVRDSNAAIARRGIRTYHAVAQTPDALVVAWTQLCAFPSRPRAASQWATVVDPAHRGHRLGLAVKLANLAQLRQHEPQVTDVWTGNAAANEHMLRVNRAMGFVAKGAFTEWQREI